MHGEWLAISNSSLLSPALSVESDPWDEMEMPLPIDSVTGETGEEARKIFELQSNSERIQWGKKERNKMHACIWLLLYASLGKCYFWKMDIHSCPIRIAFIFKWTLVHPNRDIFRRRKYSLILSSSSPFFIVLPFTQQIQCVLFSPPLPSPSLHLSRNCFFSLSSSQFTLSFLLSTALSSRFTLWPHAWLG